MSDLGGSLPASDSDPDGPGSRDGDGPVDDVSPGAERPRNESDLVSALDVSHISVQPGEVASLDITVTNVGSVIDGITAIVDGVDPDWVRLHRPVVSIFPDESGSVDISFDTPKNCPAGDYLVVVRLVSTIDPSRQSVHDFWLTVQPVAALALDLVPQIVNAGGSGRLGATVHNEGNAIANVRVTAFDPTRETDVVVDPAAFFVPAGEAADVEISMRGKRPWFGQPAARQILVSAAVDDVVVEKTATFNQRPRIPRGLLTIFILAAIVCLWALLFIFAIDALRQQTPPAKAVGTSFQTGQTSIPLALVDASVDGTVTAATNGDGIARLTVEAFRQTTDGTLEPSGSAATLDDGTFDLPSLLPGSYLFKVSGDGFAETWYPDITGPVGEEDWYDPDLGPDGAETVELAPQASVAGIDVVVAGETGRIVGAIDLPPNTETPVLTVTVTQIPPPASTEPTVDTDGDGVPDAVAPQPEPFSVTTTTTDGTIDVDGLPTPDTYIVTVTGDGFSTLEFEQFVDGGNVTVLNTVSAVAADGEISGSVVDQSLAPVGDITVTVRSGDFSATATTPTAGNTGAFRFIDLVTPATYVLTFEADNFSTSTVALDLGPGEGATGVVGRVVGGDGIVNGSAVSTDGFAVGGLTVEVVGEGFRQETATLTSGGLGGAAGSFEMENLPIPGAYTITLSGDGFQTETLEAVFDDAGVQSIGEVTMSSVTSELAGLITSGGAGIGQATVTLSTGVRDFVTISASNPPGRYSFSGVVEGTYTVLVEQNGFEPKVVLVRVDGGVDVDRDIDIERVTS